MENMSDKQQQVSIAKKNQVDLPPKLKRATPIKLNETQRATNGFKTYKQILHDHRSSAHSFSFLICASSSGLKGDIR